MTRKEQKVIEQKLSRWLGICHCQRKIKSIVTVLSNIKYKIENKEKSWTGEEYLIVALLDSNGLITHGVNIEYPILAKEDFWLFIDELMKIELWDN